MDANFWHERWQRSDIGFHEGEANALMVKHFGVLDLKPGNRIFLPLCGKTRDIAWFLSRGHRVVGAELSRIAVEQLFDELGVKPQVGQAGAVKRYGAEGIEVFVGNIFDLGAQMAGPVDAVYDRAALVAMPGDMRERYAKQVREISGRAPQLLICFEYDQSQMDGPPFSVDAGEVARVHGDAYRLTEVEGVPVAARLKGKVDAVERVWHLH